IPFGSPTRMASAAAAVRACVGGAVALLEATAAAGIVGISQRTQSDGCAGRDSDWMGAAAMGVTIAGAATTSDPGTDGSAMSCGLVLLAAKAKLDAAFWLPDVRLAAAVYVYTFFVPLSTIQISLTLLGLMVTPVGDELAASMVQLPSKEPDRLYL